MMIQYLAQQLGSFFSEIVGCSDKHFELTKVKKSFMVPFSW